MRQILLALTLLISSMAVGQEWHPEWYILEKGAEVGILKPGINDLIYHMQVAKPTQISRDEIAKINARLSYKPGHAVLVYAKSADELYMATDVEGRTLIVKGPFTKAKYDKGSTPAYVKKQLILENEVVGVGSYVWVVSWDKATNTAMVQGTSGTQSKVSLNDLYLVDETAATMMNEVKMRPVE